jgi:uncharacterized protein
MISEEEKSIITDVASKYEVKRVILFGSSLESDTNYNDIDLGVEGVKPGKFFEFYGKLMFALTKPVDIVDLKNDTAFNRLVKRDGVLIFG